MAGAPSFRISAKVRLFSSETDTCAHINKMIKAIFPIIKNRYQVKISIQKNNKTTAY
jgi:hypothetical protein